MTVDTLLFAIPMITLELKRRMIKICDEKIEAKGNAVGLSFYAFFKNKNDNPQELMDAATWWIQMHRLDHFEKADKIRDMIVCEL